MQLLITVLSALAAPIVRTLPSDVGTINLEVVRGDLTVRYAADASRTRLEVTPQGWRSGCGLQLSGDSTAVTARIVHDSGMAGLSCRSQVEIVLAGPSALSIRVTTGRITTTQTPGRQEISLGTGRVSGSIGEGRVRVEQGWVSLGELSEGLDVAVNIGNIQLDYRTPPRGALSARAEMGNVIVRLPSESSVSSQVRSGVGIREQHFPVSAAAGVEVRVESQLGNARLIAAQGTRPDSAGSHSTSP